MSHNTYNTLQSFAIPGGASGKFYSLPELAKTYPNVAKLPHSMRIVLESVLRNLDGKKVSEAHVKQVANWGPIDKRVDEIPFVVARVVLQDLTGIPLLADLAAMRNVAKSMGHDPKKIEPLVPVDLVVDHSVMIDHYGSKDALDLNQKIEFDRNKERYQFMKWGMQAFDTFKVVPPGIGIVHQVNLEYLAPGVHHKGGVYYPDSLVGTDSHTTMINGIGVVGWGVGGIEAEAGMLGQPVYFLTPDVVGVNLKGKLKEGVTATDLVLVVTELLRKSKVVGKFVEFFGEGAASLSVADRATIGNMAPEYGATMGFFPIDNATVEYLKNTGRTAEQVAAFEAYYKAQGMFGMPKTGELNYSQVIELDISTVNASLAGPKRPQDRIELPAMAGKFQELFAKPGTEGGFNKQAADMGKRHMLANGVEIGNGDVLIAAITSCTNTSNPSVLIAAGLLAKKAVERGLTVRPHVKTSLAPGSRIVTDYLERSGLLPYLEKLGFNVAAYGCTTCIGNGGDLTPEINDVIAKNDLVCTAVLSGNRNFEARIHANIKANYLAAPPLVVAYAIAGNVNKNLSYESLGTGKDGRPVYLADIWPTSQEIAALLGYAQEPAVFRKLYSNLAETNPLWKAIAGSTGQVYDWPKSTYIAEPPFFKGFGMAPTAAAAGVTGARALALLGDSITTDHISPASSIKDTSPAGKFLIANNVQKADFNSYGSRRGNHDVMMRGTFANVRIRNLMMPANADGSMVEGGVTLHQPTGEKLPIYDAAMKYIDSKTPTIVFGGEEYGSGSSRDWAAKGSALLGVKAVITRSFERIHRANLVGMGVLPLQFKGTDSIQTLKLKGDETFDIKLPDTLAPQQDATLTIHRLDGTKQDVTLLSRIDTPIEVDYYKHGGILPFVLRDLLGGAKPAAATAATGAAALAGAAGVAAVAAHVAKPAATATAAATTTTTTAATTTAGVSATKVAAGAAAAGAAAATVKATTETKKSGFPWWLWLIPLAIALWLLRGCMGDAKKVEAPVTPPVVEKKVEAPAPAPAPTWSLGSWLAGALGPKVTLEGKVKDQAAKDALLNPAKATFGEANVIDKLALDPNAAAFNWNGKWNDLFAWLKPTLLAARDGKFSVDGNTVTLTGKVDSDAIKADIEAKVKAILGDGFKVVNNLVVEAAKRVALDVHFDTASAKIKPQYFKQLNEFAAQLKKDGAKGEVGGHTDNVGKPESNQTLSEARAQSVMGYLVKQGVAADALTAAGYGELKPIADNATAEGKAKNRRIEFTAK